MATPRFDDILFAKGACTRTTVFSQMTAVILTTELIAPPVGAALMAKSPWIPFLTSTVIAAASVVWGVLFFPAIHNQTKPSATSSDEERPVRTWYVSEKIRELYEHISQNKNAALVVVSFFVTLVGTHAFALLLQYISKRFHVSYAEVCSPGAFHIYESIVHAERYSFSDRHHTCYHFGLVLTWCLYLFYFPPSQVFSIANMD